MSAELTETEARRSKGFISLQDCYLSSRIMDVRRKNSSDPFGKMNPGTPFGVEGGKRRENYQRAYSQGHNISRRRMFWAIYFSLESVLVLICLAASLLILPLILPPLPPPPFMLLLIPFAILALLMVLAFMPSNARDLTSTYM